MGDLSDFQRGQTVGPQIAGVIVKEIFQLLGDFKKHCFKVMTAYEKEGKLALQSIFHSDHSSSLSERDRRTLNHIVKEIIKPLLVK